MKNSKNILLVIGILGVCASFYGLFTAEDISIHIIGITSSGGLLCGALGFENKDCKTDQATR